MLYYHNGEVEIKKGQLLKEFEDWGPYFKVEADITVNKATPAECCNVFHFTANDNNCCDHGDRIPFLFINEAGHFHVSSSVNGNGNYYQNYEYELGKKYHMVIQQCFENGELVYKIMMDDEVFLSEVNSNPLTFELVKLYAGQPWKDHFDAEYGSLENLKVSNCSTGGY